MKRLTVLKSKSSVGAVWSLADGLLTQVLGLTVFIINTHYLPPKAFGALATAIVLVELVRQLIFFPLARSVNSQNKVNDVDYNIIFFLSLLISILLSVFVFVFASTLDRLFAGSELSSLDYYIASSLVLISVSTVYESVLVRRLEFRNLAIRSIMSVTLGGLIGLWMATHGYGIWSLVTQQLTQQAVSLLAIVSLSDWRPRPVFEMSRFKEILAFGTHVSLNSFIGFIGYQADTLTIASFLGPTDTGLFNSAKRIGTALNQVILKPLDRVALPAFAQFGDDIAQLTLVYLRALRVTSIATAPVFFGVAVISNDIVGVLFGQKWDGVGPILSALSISFFGTTIVQYSASVIMVARKPKLQSIFNIVFVFVSLFLMVSSTKYGIIGVSIAVIIRSLIMLPIKAILANSVLDSSSLDVLFAISPALVASILMVGSIFIVGYIFPIENKLLLVCLKIATGAVAYTISLFLLFRREVESAFLVRSPAV